MSQYLGNLAEDSTIGFTWDTCSGAGGSLSRGTPTGSSGTLYVEKIGALTGVPATISKANPGSVGDVAHGLVTGDEVFIYGATGMTEVNQQIFTVTRTDDDNFTLGVDTTSYGTYGASSATWVQVCTTGLTDTEDYRDVVGQHRCVIDLSAHAYYVAAADFEVHVLAAQIDGQTASYTLRGFSIENRVISTDANVTQWSGTNVATPSVAGIPEVDLTHCGGSVVPAGAIPNAAADAAGGLPISDTGGLDLDALNIAAVRLTAVRAQVLDDWIAAGRLDSILGDIHNDVGNIALTGAAVSTPAKDSPNGFIITWGENEANNEDSTHALDGTTHDIEAQLDTATQKIDVYYEFAIGGDGVTTGVTAHHQLDKGGGAAKNINVYAYDWSEASWDQIGTLSSGTVLSTDTFTLFTSHVGTGANIGLVRIRYDTGSVAFTSTTKLIVDQVFVEYAIVSRTVGYAGGAVWIDTNASNTNVESFVDGTADNPVSTIAAAITIAGNVGLRVFHVLPGSSITLAATLDNWEVTGFDYTLALGGQSVDNTLILGAIVSGTFSGNPNFRICVVNAITGPGAEINNCGIASSITANGAGDWFLHRCYSRVAGTGTPSFDFGSTLSTNLGVRSWSGGLEVKQMGVGVTDTMSLEGWGQLIVNANCVGGTIAIRGMFDKTDNSSGAVTFVEDARYNVAQTNKSGYSDGAIWVDTGGSNTNTVDYIDGTADNPVSTWAAALALSSSLGITQFHIATGSSITLTANSDNYVFTGINWTLALGSQSIAGAVFAGAMVTGVGTGMGPRFYECILMEGGSLTVANMLAECCILRAGGDFICSGTGAYYFINCASGVAGASTPSIDFGAAIVNTNVNFRGYSGGIEIRNMSVAGSDLMSLEGHGQLVINASCSAGTVVIRGHFTVTDNAGGALTLSDAARFALDQGLKLGDVAHGGSAATLALKSGSILNSTGTALDIQSTGGGGRGINIQGDGGGEGLRIVGGASAVAAFLALAAGSNARGISAIGSGVGPGVLIDGGDNAIGLQIVAGASSGPGISVSSQTADITGSNLLQRFADALGTMLSATVQASPAPTTTECDTELTLTNPDQLVNRVILFLDGNNVYAQSVIRASTTGGLLTYDAIPVAPTAGDTLIVI